jgi:hypothetical protein
MTHARNAKRKWPNAQPEHTWHGLYDVLGLKVRMIV